MGNEQAPRPDKSVNTSFEAAAKLHRRPEEIARLKPDRLFVLLLGPSGTGKSTLIRAIPSISDRFQYTKPCTTRPLREGETEKDFIEEAEFDRIASEGGFVSVNYMYGAKYGLRTATITDAIEDGKTPILDFPLDKIRQFDGLGYDLLTIYVFPQDTDQWLQRLRAAGRDLADRAEKGLGELRMLAGMTTPHPDIHFSIINPENGQLEATNTIVGVVNKIRENYTSDSGL